MRFCVVVIEADPSSPEAFRRYVRALSYQAYSNQQGRRLLTDFLHEAFVFKTEVAAEMAAAWTGGQVISIDFEDK